MFSFKYHCALPGDRTLVSTYGEFSEDLFKQLFDTIGNEPVVFPFRFIFATINNSSDITVQLFVFRNIKFVKISLFWSNVRRSYRILYIMHQMCEFIFWDLIIRKALKQNVAYMIGPNADT